MLDITINKELIRAALAGVEYPRISNMVACKCGYFIFKGLRGGKTMRYWVQIWVKNLLNEERAFEVILRTDSLFRAQNKLDTQVVAGFVWDCYRRIVVAQNY